MLVIGFHAESFFSVILTIPTQILRLQTRNVPPRYFLQTTTGEEWLVPGAGSRDRMVSRLPKTACLVGPTDNCGMYPFPFDQISQRKVARNGQSMISALPNICKIKQHLGFEIRQFDLVDVIPEQVIGFSRRSGCSAGCFV
jgi:hypothetical protein